MNEYWNSDSYVFVGFIGTVVYVQHGGCFSSQLHGSITNCCRQTFCKTIRGIVHVLHSTIVLLFINSSLITIDFIFVLCFMLSKSFLL